MSRFLVTGGTGFLGGHLVDLLLNEGHQVVSLVYGQGAAPATRDGLSLVAGDVLDAASVKRAAEGCDGLLHLAGKVSRDPKDAELLHRIHVDGTIATLRAAREAGVRRAVIASTSGVVAVSKDGKRPVHERDLAPMDLIARWPYYRSKLFAERAALEFANADFEVVAINPSLLLGPGDLLGSSTGDVVDFIERRIPVVPAGGMSFVDARDAARGALLAFEQGRSGERYLLASQNLTMRAFCSKLERITGIAAPPLTMPPGALVAKVGASLERELTKRLGGNSDVDPVSAEMAQYFWYVDSTKARDELGWEPRDPMETLVDTVRDLESRGVVWPAA